MLSVCFVYMLKCMYAWETQGIQTHFPSLHIHLILFPLSCTDLMYVCVCDCTYFSECIHYIYFLYRMVMKGVGKEKNGKVKAIYVSAHLNITYTKKFWHANIYIDM